MLAGVPAEYPLTSVIHTAAMLDDAMVDALMVEQMDRVLRVKAKAALNLHELTRDLDLSAFVLFSSLAALAGDAGQANYAPGNAFLDALAYHRRGRGLAATSVAWGHWAGGGIGEGVVEGRMRRFGVTSMQPELAIAALQRVLDHDETYVVVANMKWDHALEAADASRFNRMLLGLPEFREALSKVQDMPGTGPAGFSSLRERLTGMAKAERGTALLELVRAQSAEVLGHTGVETVEPNRAFNELGFDSLAGLELCNQLDTATGLRLPSTVVFDHPTPAALARFLETELFGGPAEGDTPIPRVVSVDDDPIVIVAMSCPVRWWRRDSGAVVAGGC